MKNTPAVSGAALCVGLLCGGWLRAGAAPSLPTTSDKTLKVPSQTQLKAIESVALMAIRLEKLEASHAALQKQVADSETAHAKHTHTLPFQFGPAKSVINSNGAIWTPYLKVQNAQQITGFKTNPPAK